MKEQNSCLVEAMPLLVPAELQSLVVLKVQSLYRVQNNREPATTVLLKGLAIKLSSKF